MKSLLLATLGAFCLLTSACTKDPADAPPKSGAVGSGLGGQTVGTPFAGSSGAGQNAAGGPGVRQ